MSSQFSLDPESFQNLLADAYVVQESGIDTRSLSAVMELQGLMADSELDLDRAMPLIADRARNVAQATGVAIAQLQGDQLVYRAGSGSSAANVGRRVTAILSVSRHTQSKAEILRVENAQRDGRIEAAICRQFGAESLLILPVYDNRKLVGVLEIIFSDAHSFHEQEVRTYRLMATLLGEAISRAMQTGVQPAPVEAAAMQPVLARAAPLPGVRKMEAPAVLHTPQLTQSGFSILGLSGEPASLRRDPLEPFRSVANLLAANSTLRRAYHRAASYISGVRLPDISSIRPAQFFKLRMPARRRLDEALSVLTKQGARVPYYKRWVAAGVVLLAAWVAVWGHRPAAVTPNSAIATENTIAQPAPTPAPASSAAAPSEPAKAVPPVGAVAGPLGAEPVVATRPHWVKVGSNELDYVADDVTVRYYGVKPAPGDASAHSHIKKIGSDVTVRYFKPIDAPSQEQAPGTRIHYISGESSAPKTTTTPAASQAVE